MPRSLVTSWKRVATSGPTADGREIKAQDLRDCAETYSPSKYTAVIWVDNQRGSGAHGTVYSVRLVDNDTGLAKGQVALEVQMKPNARLLQLNRDGEKLFSSVEITPNFAGSGRAYMTGLAVTDEPTSLGTQELYFSKKANNATYRTKTVPMRTAPMSKVLAASLKRVTREVSVQVRAFKERKYQVRSTKRVL
ncbi:GPO family capsid scaffolding protein [Pseudomonas juntendi]|uniref:GPO family capsid scaffolding protein n=1 Tax=Pseudomonas juntendi TaxID=2666183 RepID=A0A7W2LTQ0_9PSED|nr:GPO family capsid scaffolding protein [Pseudomonas juntendi]MBA6146869.1 GPO family capsid scaffolding protein [Pseudomonas juntendi]PYB97840.1 GPO family capsid scaffolding protein [Pseudomonas sp. MB-090624]